MSIFLSIVIFEKIHKIVLNVRHRHLEYNTHCKNVTEPRKIYPDGGMRFHFIKKAGCLWQVASYS